MPRNTSGLRRGGPGRPKGSKDSVPRSFRASVRAIFEKIGQDNPELYENAIRDGLRSRRGTTAFNFTQLAAFYLDGKPGESLEVSGAGGGPVVYQWADHFNIPTPAAPIPISGRFSSPTTQGPRSQK